MVLGRLIHRTKLDDGTAADKSAWVIKTTDLDTAIRNGVNNLSISKINTYMPRITVSVLIENKITVIKSTSIGRNVTARGVERFRPT